MIIDDQTARILYAGLHMLRSVKGLDYAIESNALPYDTPTNNINRIESIMDEIRPYMRLDEFEEYHLEKMEGV